MTAMSLRSYAKHRRNAGLPGGTLSSVQAALASGRIATDEAGLINPVVADRAWEENTDPMKRHPSYRARQEANPVYLHDLHPAIEGYYLLQELLLEVETKLEAAFGDMMSRAQYEQPACRTPEELAAGPAKPWKALYAEWEKLPDALIRLKAGIRAAKVPFLKADM